MDVIDIVDRVELVFENAWNKLVLTSAVILGIVGVIVLILIQVWQNRTLKQNEENLIRVKC